MIFNPLEVSVLLSLHTMNFKISKCVFEAERLTEEMISEEYVLPPSELIYNLLITVSAVLIAVLLICRLVLRLAEFKRELKYLNTEIRRTRGSERDYWQKRKRRLWLSVVPFFRE